MAAARPQVSIFNVADGEASKRSVALPAVFTAPIRTDVVQFVHTNMAKNKRQAYAVYKQTGARATPSLRTHAHFLCSGRALGWGGEGVGGPGRVNTT